MGKFFQLPTYLYYINKLAHYKKLFSLDKNMDYWNVNINIIPSRIWKKYKVTNINLTLDLKKKNLRTFLILYNFTLLWEVYPKQILVTYINLDRN